MTKEISDKAGLKFEGEIKEITEEENIFRGQICVSSITGINFYNSSFKIAEAALAAGYKVGDKVEYEVIIKPKQKD